MAYTKKTISRAEVSENSTEVSDNESVEPVTESTVKEEKTAKKVKKKFAPDDLIPCASITPGEMFYVGSKTHDVYTWADCDDVVYIAYADLDYAAKAKDRYITLPRFIIQDADFIKQHSYLNDIYGDIYSTNDLKKIIDYPINQIAKAVSSLPVGAQEALKVIVSTMIDNGQLDSIQKIKAFDEVFGTEMLMKMNA